MKRAELEDAIRHATRVTKQREVLVIGSQAILVSYDGTQLPERATLSEKVDVAPITGNEEYTLSTLIDANLGEGSQFHLDHGFYVQGVNITTAVLPNGWEARTIQVAPDGPSGAFARCLDPHDLCAAKLVRGEAKDIEFADALVEAGLIDPRLPGADLQEAPGQRYPTWNHHRASQGLLVEIARRRLQINVETLGVFRRL